MTRINYHRQAQRVRMARKGTSSLGGAASTAEAMKHFAAACGRELSDEPDTLFADTMKRAAEHRRKRLAAKLLAMRGAHQ